MLQIQDLVLIMGVLLGAHLLYLQDSIWESSVTSSSLGVSGCSSLLAWGSWLCPEGYGGWRECGFFWTLLVITLLHLAACMPLHLDPHLIDMLFIVRECWAVWVVYWLIDIRLSVRINNQERSQLKSYRFYFHKLRPLPCICEVQGIPVCIVFPLTEHGGVWLATSQLPGYPFCCLASDTLPASRVSLLSTFPNCQWVFPTWYTLQVWIVKSVVLNSFNHNFTNFFL